MQQTLQQLIEANEAPEWLTHEGLQTLRGGYLLPGETPRGMYARVSHAAARRLERPDLAERFFDILWKNWLCLASPVAANMGTERGLPISCNTIHVADDLFDIGNKNTELMMLSKYGAGVGIYMGDVRARGVPIRGTGGLSDGVMAWNKIYDSSIHSTNQGATRRGAAAVYLPVGHGDFDEFLGMRRPTGDLNKRCLNLNQGAVIDDAFMRSLEAGDVKNRKLWEEILTTRVETGEPYLLFIDNVNRQNPASYKNRDMLVKTSNICIEIMLYTDQWHTFVCCLSSMNLVRWDEWKDTDAVELAIWFLDAVMSEYIDKAKDLPGFANAVRFAEKSRAIGLGGLGWHSLLQARSIPFDSLDAMMLNAQIWRHMRAECDRTTAELAHIYGEPEWCEGLERRHTHCLAAAPTVSNAKISGGFSPSIEPWAANYFVEASAKGTFIRKNPQLEALLVAKGRNDDATWTQIHKDGGSVQGLNCLSDHEKTVFLTAREINQFAIIRQAAQRQQWIDQGQSVNLFFGSNSDPRYIHEVHMEAWRSGIKGLYYCRSESILRADLATRQKDECAACEA